ncbi:MAG: ABC transporter substrate-binding protein [Nitrospinota bacterium]
MGNRSILRGAALALTLAGFFAFARGAGAAEKLTFNLGWVPFGRDVAWYTALEKGYYAEEGLDVNLVRGWGSRDTAQKIASGQGDVGTIDTGSLVIGRDKGMPLRMIIMQHYTAPYVIWTTKGSGVNTLKDLEGRTLGVAGADATYANLPALAEINNIDLSKIKVVVVEPASRAPMLMAGRYDASTGFVLEFPRLAFLGKKNKKRVKFLLLARSGLDIYGVGLGATQRTLKERGGAVRKFLRASVKGVAYARKHPDASMKYLFKHAPDIMKVPNRMVWDITLDLWEAPEQKTLGIGHTTRRKWTKTRDILVKANKIRRTIPVDDLYTNDFLPKILPPARGPRRTPKLF